MAKSLNVTSAGIQLVVTSYLIIISATILVFGRLGDIVGKTKVFKFGIALFTLGSLFCGITSSLPLLVLARVIQAIGAAGTMANSQGIITEVFPANERGKALGITGTFVALGALVGPPLGGFIVDATSWEYIFLINVPIGIITLFYGFKILPKGTQNSKGKIGWTRSIIVYVCYSSSICSSRSRTRSWIYSAHNFVRLFNINYFFYCIYYGGKET